jgi:hypothetical protein
MFREATGGEPREECTDCRGAWSRHAEMIGLAYESSRSLAEGAKLTGVLRFAREVRQLLIAFWLVSGLVMGGR